MRNTRLRAAILLGAGLLALAIGACSSDSSRASSPTTRARKAVLSSPNLRITIDPPVGEPGTKVAIVVTGCNDPSGLNHAVSFNNNALDSSARNDPNIVRSVHVASHHQMLTGSYTMRDDDRTGGTGMFFVQCGGTTKQAVFAMLAQ